MNVKKIMDYFRGGAPRQTASLAKERLQIIVSHERIATRERGVDFLPQLEQELLDVIAKYMTIDREQVKVQLARDGDLSVLELNVTLPDQLKKDAS